MSAFGERPHSEELPRATDSTAIKTFEECLSEDGSDLASLQERHNYKFLWTRAANCILGLWLIVNPCLFQYKSNALQISDITCGALLILFALLSFHPRLSLLRLASVAVAFWLLFAPLLFWAPSPAIYLVDTLIAIFVIVFSLLLPGLPGQAGIELAGPDIPPGWTYNPSSWIRRWIGIALALLGFFISRYLACHQLGFLTHSWDPFFGEGTDKVVTSSVSRSFPISDAGFGAIAYVLEVLAGFMGGRARWRTAPWTVVSFALLVLPLGVTSVVLVITQPTFVGSWCGLCLVAAAGLLTSVPLAVHEAIAVGQFLRDGVSQGKSFWSLFWHGGNTAAGAPDPDRFNYSIFQRWLASIQGVTVPLTLLLELVVGVWLMARPDLIAASTNSALCDHLIGALVLTTATVATAEVTRIVRFANVFNGIILMVATAVLAHNSLVLVSGILSGIILIFASLPKGAIVEQYGSWNKFVK